MSINVENGNRGISAINVSFLAGRNFQKYYNNGVANLCSQSLHNGSKTYDKKHFSFLPMKLGGVIDSGINDLFAYFNIRGLDENITDMIDLLFSMVFEPEFNDIDKQKKIIKNLNATSNTDTFKVLLDAINRNMLDSRFAPIKLDKTFDLISKEEVNNFYMVNYINPAVSVVSSMDNNYVSGYIKDTLNKYNVHDIETLYVGDDFDYYSVESDSVHIKWDFPTNRLLMYTVIDNDPMYDILASVLQYRVNKILRIDKALCGRNRCIILPHGLEKRILCIDVEFSDYSNTSEIIYNIYDILNNIKFTEDEFIISKNYKVGQMLYLSSDPVKKSIFNSEKMLISGTTYDEYLNKVQDCSYIKSIDYRFDSFRYVIGTN